MQCHTSKVEGLGFTDWYKNYISQNLDLDQDGDEIKFVQ